MLMYGNTDNIIDNSMIFNLTSMKLGDYPNLKLLIPPNEVGQFTGKDFDIAYMQYIMGNDFVFKEFFDIVYCLYIGKDVYVLVSDNDWSENLVESLFKLIQQRYGYNGFKVNCIDDYYFNFNKKYISEFDHTYGIYNLDLDKERYTMIVETSRIRAGGPVVYAE